jgi:hypothetical protein
MKDLMTRIVISASAQVLKKYWSNEWKEYSSSWNLLNPVKARPITSIVELNGSIMHTMLKLRVNCRALVHGLIEENRR